MTLIKANDDVAVSRCKMKKYFKQIFIALAVIIVCFVSLKAIGCDDIKVYLLVGMAVFLMPFLLRGKSVNKNSNIITDHKNSVFTENEFIMKYRQSGKKDFFKKADGTLRYFEEGTD